jgi:hypothetical protein
MILWVYGKEMLFFIYMQIFTDGIATKKIVRHFFADFKNWSYLCTRKSKWRDSSAG